MPAVRAPSRIVTTGLSQAADFTSRQLDEILEGLRQPVSLDHGLRSARGALLATFEECGTPGWDGYGAEPVALQTYQLADSFLEALPPDIPMPTVGAEPDGHLTLEWYVNPNRVLSVSVSPEADLHSAALLGGSSRQSGTEPFFGDVPEEILRIIRRVLAT